MEIIIGIGVLVLVGIYFMVSYNGFIKLRNKAEEAFSTMDVYLKKRYDLIPNLVETVKGYATHEKSTLENVIKARNIAMSAGSIEEKQAGELGLLSGLKSLFALSENYPDLKANSNFIDLQQQLQKIEEDISQARKYYNAVIKSYNTKVEMFPQSIIAGMFGFTRKSFFEIQEIERENVQIKF